VPGWMPSYFPTIWGIMGLVLIALVRNERRLSFVSAVLLLNWIVGRWATFSPDDQYDPLVNFVIDYASFGLVIAGSFQDAAARLASLADFRNHRKPFDVGPEQMAAALGYLMLVFAHGYVAFELWRGEAMIQLAYAYWYGQHWLTWGQILAVSLIGLGGGHVAWVNSRRRRDRWRDARHGVPDRAGVARGAQETQEGRVTARPDP
jgi:hypothetical protein